MMPSTSIVLKKLSFSLLVKDAVATVLASDASVLIKF